MSLHVTWGVHALPLWFLVFSLFLPRLSLLVFWAQNGDLPQHLHGWIPVAAAVLLPRVLIAYLVYRDQGVTVWLVIHVLAALGVWSSIGSRGRRRSDQR